jgi:hypothetical protein
VIYIPVHASGEEHFALYATRLPYHHSVFRTGGAIGKGGIDRKGGVPGLAFDIVKA